jgi:hypothetical protein
MAAQSVRHNSYPFYAFRLWNGMTAAVLLRLFARHRFAISPSRLPYVLLGLVYAINMSVLKVIQAIIFSRRIRASTLERPPVFIIGHWRTGTTLLHELLTLDNRFVGPTTLECLAPAQCLAFGWLIRLLAFLLPANRPMDNMLVGWDQPQEDEFALMTLGFGSPYEAMVFPNRRRVDHPYLNMTELAPAQVEAWKTGLLRFLQQVRFRSNRGRKRHNGAVRIVLKSPTHTARLHILRELFPGAQFIHVVRHPCDVFASTVRLWQALYDTQGCQKPDYGTLSNGAPALERYVLDTMDLLYRDFFIQAAHIPTQNFCQVRYEDLVHAPVAEMARIYQHLDLGSFDKVRPKLEARLQALAGYKPNEHRIPDERTAEVCRRWDWYMKKFGYRTPAYGDSDFVRIPQAL